MKGFQKDNPGKPKGAKNQKTKQWQLLADSIVNEHADKFNRELDKLEGKEFIQAYTQVLEYFEPKLARTESKTEISGEGIHFHE